MWIWLRYIMNRLNFMPKATVHIFCTIWYISRAYLVQLIIFLRHRYITLLVNKWTLAHLVYKRVSLPEIVVYDVHNIWLVLGFHRFKSAYIHTCLFCILTCLYEVRAFNLFIFNNNLTVLSRGNFRESKRWISNLTVH